MSGGFIPAGYMRLADYVESSSVDEVGSALAAGTLKAFLVGRGGDLQPVGVAVWRGPNGRQHVEMGGFSGYPDAGGDRRREYVIERPRPRPVQPRLTLVPNAAKGGRPQKWDWEGALIELSRLDAVDGTENKSGADLAQHLSAWFVAQTGDTPADSEIRKRVKRFREMLKT